MRTCQLLSGIRKSQFLRCINFGVVNGCCYGTKGIYLPSFVGTGSLTDELLGLDVKVTAIEADPRLYVYLVKKYAQANSLF